METQKIQIYVKDTGDTSSLETSIYSFGSSNSSLSDSGPSPAISNNSKLQGFKSPSTFRSLTLASTGKNTSTKTSNLDILKEKHCICKIF